MRSLNNLMKTLRLNKLKAMERKVLKTPEEHKKNIRLQQKYSQFYMVCHTCHKKFFKKLVLKKHMQDEQNNKIFIDMYYILCSQLQITCLICEKKIWSYIELCYYIVKHNGY